MGAPFGKRFKAGFALRRSSMAVRNYPGASAVALDTGILIHLPYNLRFGAMAHTVGRFMESGQETDSPRVVQVGISRTGERLTVSFQLDHHPRHGYSTRMGQEFLLVEYVTIRAGLDHRSFPVLCRTGTAKGARENGLCPVVPSPAGNHAPFFTLNGIWLTCWQYRVFR